MNNENINSKLTPSAKEALNELTEDFKENLIEKAYTIAKERNTANREISLRDILEAQQPSQNIIEKQKYTDYRRKRWTMLISFSGAIYAIAGILLYLFQNKKFSIENDLGLIIAVIGILLTLLAFIYGQLINKRQYLYTTTTTTTNNFSEIDSFEIVKRWQIIEQLTVSVMKEKNISDSKSNSVSQVIKYLTENFTKSEVDYLNIKQLLQSRNKILHEGYSLSDAEKKKYIEIADNLIEKLEHAKK
ncbi:hypothetical protein [Chryseobacterium sp. W4I1]|uniref:hypothetical protein n=1 Tax=Chryseobacterium sp. W4I1 TaxID=3042293 RepID=UPI002784A7A5|nr:hypothetical protein [Chryseobacterium sp. W4I1]MDQ0781344.1 hypothetical protein [Chryseobacterium sp. W4I1]